VPCRVVGLIWSAGANASRILTGNPSKRRGSSRNEEVSTVVVVRVVVNGGGVVVVVVGRTVVTGSRARFKDGLRRRNRLELMVFRLLVLLAPVVVGSRDRGRDTRCRVRSREILLNRRFVVFNGWLALSSPSSSSSSGWLSMSWLRVVGLDLVVRLGGIVLSIGRRVGMNGCGVEASRESRLSATVGLNPAFSLFPSSPDNCCRSASVISSAAAAAVDGLVAVCRSTVTYLFSSALPNGLRDAFRVWSLGLDPASSLVFLEIVGVLSGASVTDVASSWTYVLSLSLFTLLCTSSTFFTLARSLSLIPSCGLKTGGGVGGGSWSTASS